MVRRLLVGMAVVLSALTWTSSPAAAQPHYAQCEAPRATTPVANTTKAPASTVSRKEGDVTFTIGGLPGESTLRAQGKGVTFFKRVTANRVHVRIDVSGDSVALDAEPTGTARLTRNGKTLQLRMTTGGDDVARAQRFLAGSKALVAFESLAMALEASTRPEAQSVMTSFALVHAVRGSGAPARALAKSVSARQAANAVRASAKTGEEMPYECWINYAVTMNTYVYEFDQCYRDYGWLPGMNAVCAFEFSVKAELAWFWVIGCSGGIPV